MHHPFFFFMCKNKRRGELKLFLKVKYFMLAGVCHKIVQSLSIANSDKKIVLWLPALLHSCLVSERGNKWMVLFFAVSVSLLARSVLLISFPVCIGCQTLSVPMYYPPLSALSLQLSSHPVWVWTLPTQRKEKAIANDWCQYKLP